MPGAGGELSCSPYKIPLNPKCLRVVREQRMRGGGGMYVGIVFSNCESFSLILQAKRDLDFWNPYKIAISVCL